MFAWKRLFPIGRPINRNCTDTFFYKIIRYHQNIKILQIATWRNYKKQYLFGASARDTKTRKRNTEVVIFFTVIPARKYQAVRIEFNKNSN